MTPPHTMSPSIKARSWPNVTLIKMMPVEDPGFLGIEAASSLIQHGS